MAILKQKWIDTAHWMRGRQGLEYFHRFGPDAYMTATSGKMAVVAVAALNLLLGGLDRNDMEYLAKAYVALCMVQVVLRTDVEGGGFARFARNTAVHAVPGLAHWL